MLTKYFDVLSSLEYNETFDKLTINGYLQLILATKKQDLLARVYKNADYFNLKKKRYNHEYKNTKPNNIGPVKTVIMN